MINILQSDPAQDSKTVLKFGTAAKPGNAAVTSVSVEGWAVRKLVRNPESAAPN